MNNDLNFEFITSVVEEYADMIVRIAFNYTRNMFDAEDIAQSVFLSLLSAPYFKDKTHLKAWLIRTAINKAKDLLKSARKKRTLPLEAAEKYFAPETISVLDEIEKLQNKDRTIVYLFYFEGYKAKEIGNILNLKERAVLVRLKRARDKLKILLEKSYGEKQ